MCRLQNIAMRDYKESVTTGQTDAGQSDHYVQLSSQATQKLYEVCTLIKSSHCLLKNI